MTEPDRDSLLAMYRTMVTIKACDEQFRSALMSGQAAINYYSPRGQEAISAGAVAALRTDDYVVTTYRGLHDHIAKGVPLRELWAEFLGKAPGLCKGKGGGMHVTHPASGLMVTTGVVGGGLPIANGLALSSQLRGDGRVTVCNFGDGASNIGGFHEALNLASVWTLPIVFVCQNNRYAESTAYAKATSAERVSDRAASYSMPGVTIDGNDPVAVRDAVARAVERARAGDGPSLVEAVAFRFFGHHFGDESHYIPEAEMAAALAEDPIPRFEGWLITHGHARADDLAQIADEAAAAADDAARFALDAPYPDVDDLTADVYAGSA